MNTNILKRGKSWFNSLNWKLNKFQKKAWDSYSLGKSGLVNAPTGSGKTYSLLIPTILDFFDKEYSSGRVA